MMSIGLIALNVAYFVQRFLNLVLRSMLKRLGTL
jgi:hypothetical protein